MTASAYSLSILVPAGGFAVTQGDTVLGGLKGGARHHFCPSCMSWMFTRPEGMEDFVNIRATMLDHPGWAAPFVETYTSERLPWATTPAVHSFPQFPPIGAFASLIEDFGKRGPRPVAGATSR